ncbi:hypothetical protein MTO96_051254 [Rhipicephalus appendiculatus]
MELINRVLNQNRTLTSFNLIGCAWDEAERQLGVNGDHRIGSSAGVARQIHSLLVALTKNNTLQELTLTSSWFDTKECRSLFKAVASHASLKKVNLSVSERDDAAEINRAMRETAHGIASSLGTHRAPSEKCSCVHGVEGTARRQRRQASILRLRPVARHAKPAPIVQSRDLAVSPSEAGNVERQGLEVHGSCSGETETHLLVHTLQSSRTLCHVSFFPDEADCVTSLVRELSPNISSNYTLLSMSAHDDHLRGSDWFPVADVIRRNCALVTRAAHFVKGTRLKYCAAAAEVMFSNPALVEKVQELLSIDEGKAVSRIQKSLKSFSGVRRLHAPGWGRQVRCEMPQPRRRQEAAG